MSTDPLAAVWPRLDSEPPVFFGDREGPEFPGSRDRLADHGLLREIEPSRFTLCRACGDGHVRRVIWLDDAPGGGRRGYVPCPACGPVRIDPVRLRRWAIDVPRLLGEVFRAAGGRAALEELVRGHLWYLGAATWCGRPRQAYFARFVHGHPRAAVLAALGPHPRAVLFHPTERAARLWEGVTPNPVVALESVVTLGPDGTAFDPAVVEGRLAEVGLAGAPQPKRPPRKSRADKIERLTREVVEHLRAAREHASAKLELTGAAELLPRPTQQQLAARCGLTEPDATRCFQDESARELNLYWGAALDLDRVMNFHGPVGAGPSA